jgi:lipid-A-disaccharide synthase
MPHLVPLLTELTARWPVRARILVEDADKYSAFRRARAALAASGTVTLELALAGVPSVAAYRIPAAEGLLFRLMANVHPVVRVRSVILANLVLGEFAIPEFLQRRCMPEMIAPALVDILGDPDSRARQLAAFKRIEAILGANGIHPSERAAQAVLDLLDQRSRPR